MIRKRYHLAAFAVVGTLVITSCSSDEKKSDSTTATTAAATTSAASDTTTAETTAETTADTLKELAEKLEISVDGLQQTVDEINAAVIDDRPFSEVTRDGRATRGVTPPKTNWAQTISKPPYVAYACTGGCTRLNYWSNPNRTYNGQPMGTTTRSDNTRVLNNTRTTVAGFR